jgi:DUF1680 family protein
MNRRNFLRSAAILPIAASASPSFASQNPAPTPVPALATPTAASPVPSGDQTPVQARYQQTLDRVLNGQSPAYTQEFILEDVIPTPGRRFTEYSGDVSGRYIGALSTASRVYGTQFPDLDALVAKTIALQKPEGYFGSNFRYDQPGDHDLALLWGNGRLLVGLTEYYRLKPSPQVLAACNGIGNFLVRIAPLMMSKAIRDEFGAQHFASSYICWTQQTEGLANLYDLTHDKRYADLTTKILAVTERRPGDHVHGYLCSLRGGMDLYHLNHDPVLLATCEAAWTSISNSPDALITGGVPEGWSPNNHRTEGCGEADWLRLNLALWRATANPKYVTTAERTAFNEFSFNQFATGDFGHHVYTETGLPAAGAIRAWWCCTLHGLRAFPDLQTHAFSERVGKQHKELSFDLPIDAQYKFGEQTVTATSALAQDGSIRITAAGSAKPLTLHVRKPEWAETLTLSLEGALISAPIDSNYAKVEWTPKPGEPLTIQYKMSLRIEPAGKDRVSYWFGPWLLGVPASDNPAYFNELTTDNRLVRATNQQTTASSTSHFAIPIAAQTFHYIPAEYADQPGTVTLRPIAEQAGQPTTSWELRLLTTT